MTDDRAREARDIRARRLDRQFAKVLAEMEGRAQFERALLTLVLRALFLISGGGLIVILAFAGQITAAGHPNAPVILGSLGLAVRYLLIALSGSVVLTACAFYTQAIYIATARRPRATPALRDAVNDPEEEILAFADDATLRDYSGRGVALLIALGGITLGITLVTLILGFSAGVSAFAQLAEGVS